LLALEAAYFSKIRKTTEAMALLKMPELENLEISMQLNGMHCLKQGSVDCARASFQKLYQKSNRNIHALYGLTWVAMQEKDRNKAYEFAKVGLQIEPGYLPLIELRDQLETKW
jgi:lipopolysaccharide biosynthesis regulator YciM